MWKIIHSSTPTQADCLQKSKAAFAKLKAREDLGFLRLPLDFESLQTRVRDIQKSAKHLVILGIGGSALGAHAILNALKDQSTIHIIDNVDSFSFWQKVKSLHLARCHFLLVSKSGQTIETLTQAEFIEQTLLERSLPGLSQVSTVISEFEQNPLTEWAKKENIPIFEIPKNVGGRFSVLTPVGLFPAAFAGLELKGFETGATWAKTQADLVSEIAAQTLMSFEREEWITMLWSYCDRLHSFGFWLQQLWAESLAKSVDRTKQKAPRVSTPIPCVGSTDQHSILQQVMEGANDKFIFFFRVEESEGTGPKLNHQLFRGQEIMKAKTMGTLFSAQADATRDALSQQKVLSLSLSSKTLNETSLGALFMIFQLVIGTLGEALNIDAYNQPGVEAGKIITKKTLSL
jgi:glucose-6-phosphate isomerase